VSVCVSSESPGSEDTEVTRKAGYSIQEATPVTMPEGSNEAIVEVPSPPFGLRSMSDADLLRAAVDASGLSLREFSTAVLKLSPRSRTASRWIAGRGLPDEIREYLRDYLTTHTDAHTIPPSHTARVSQ
jgi:hypothetical protein